MRVAIIGSGIYGCFIALKLKEMFNSNITIYEKNSDIMSAAIMNNQHRLHQGYHYPRSKETINECLESYDNFLMDFNDCIEKIDNNFYLIHKNSYVNYEEYINIYKNLNLNFEIIDKNIFFNNEKYVRKEDITGIIKVEEKTIKLDILKRTIKDKLKNSNIEIILNSKITNKEICEFKKEYDYVINCTYNDFNLNLINKKEIKHELCSLLLIDNYFDKNKSYTIMDGNFVSIYSNGYDKHTISSVKETPFLKFDDDELEFYSKNINNIFNDLDVKKKILEDAEKYFIIDDSKIHSHYLTIKTKEKYDTNDKRETFYIKEDNYISIFCGKISSIYVLWKKLKNELC